MPETPEFLLPRRSYPAHGVKLIDGQPTVIFDTICTKDRTPWLANQEVHTTLKEVWQEAEAWLMGKYVVMPDHVHFFAWYTRSMIKYEGWVRYWKSQFSKKYKHPECEWQVNHWDTRLRDSRQYESKWLYVRDNPIRKQLVEHPDDWPYQGEICQLKWESTDVCY
ncbi:MAG: hypothetical protein JWN70_1553 [Planctomycetaceae bacterium]|nr:hypothetical protein [Planctomycetaceae bacterium]